MYKISITLLCDIKLLRNVTKLNKLIDRTIQL